MGYVAVNRQHHAGTIDAFGDFRGRDTNYSPMPTFPSDYRHIRVGRLGGVAVHSSTRQRDDQLLNFLALSVALIEMQSEPSRFLYVSGAEEFNNRARGI